MVTPQDFVHRLKLALEVSIIDSGSERVNLKPFYDVESGG